MNNNDNREYEGLWRMSPRRKHRKDAYIGFLPYEQETFSKLPLNIPYAKTMRKNRLKLFQQAKAEGWTATQYKQAVAWEYESRGILRTGDWKGYAFALLRWFETEWHKTADPNDPYLLRQTRKHHGHRELVDRTKVIEQKRKYNALPSTKEKRRKYRLEHRDQIRDAERKRKLFKRGLA